jgi:hypothetical protein
LELPDPSNDALRGDRSLLCNRLEQLTSKCSCSASPICSIELSNHSTCSHVAWNLSLFAPQSLGTPRPQHSPEQPRGLPPKCSLGCSSNIDAAQLLEIVRQARLCSWGVPIIQDESLGAAVRPQSHSLNVYGHPTSHTVAPFIYSVSCFHFFANTYIGQQRERGTALTIRTHDTRDCDSRLPAGFYPKHERRRGSRESHHQGYRHRNQVSTQGI